VKTVHNKDIGRQVYKIHGQIGKSNFISNKHNFIKNKITNYKYFTLFFKPIGDKPFNIALKFLINNKEEYKISFSNFYKKDKKIRNNIFNFKINFEKKWIMLIFDIQSFFKSINIETKPLLSY